MLLILHLYQKKAGLSGLPLIFSDLTLTLLLDVLRNAITYKRLKLKTQRQTLLMKFAAFCWEVNVLIGTLRVMRGMRLETECNFRRP